MKKYIWLLLIVVFLFLIISYTIKKANDTYKNNRNLEAFLNKIASNDQYSESNSSMIKTALTWSRMAQIPKEAKNVNVKEDGSPFTRSYRITFNLKENNIKIWLHKSKGIIGAETIKINNNSFKYIIKPGAGAQYAEVVIDYETKFVCIYTWWS